MGPRQLSKQILLALSVSGFLLGSVDALTSAGPSSLALTSKTQRWGLVGTRGRVGQLTRQVHGAEHAVQGIPLRLRGGKEIPVDMRMMHWWLHNPVAWVFIVLFFGCSAYLWPAMPKFDQPMTKHFKVELKIGSAMLAIGFAIVLAGPWLESKFGYWSMGFLPEAHFLLMFGTVLVWHVLGEYTALCRDAQLVEETRNPYLPTFDTNYRMFG